MKTVGLLAAGVLLLGLAGCGHHGMGYGHGSEDMGDRVTSRMNALIEKSVQDQGKAQKAQTIVANMAQEIKDSYKGQRQFHRMLYELNANYNATPEDFTKILDEMSNARMKSASKILVLRFQLKELLTADEWKTLSENMASYGKRYAHD